MSKVNLSPTREPMPTLAPDIRRHTFDEVALGYTEEMAIREAHRCLNCKNMPCVEGCPVRVNIPRFIEKVKEGDFAAAYAIISETSGLPAVCGRVCPQETQCEARCVRGIKGESVGIGRLERFVADWHHTYSTEHVTKPTPNGHRVAIVGSGPSGLSCAASLAKLGYAVTIFEALHTAGGVLVYGIPEFRLPNATIERELDALRALGVEIRTNVVIGRTLTVDELFASGYEAVFIGSGAGLPNFMGIPGEGLNGVYSANEYLTRSNLMGAHQRSAHTPIMRGGKVAVVGGGNVAMDAARTALRLGADEVSIVYRRSMEELPARHEEVEHAMEEGIHFRLLTNPVELLGHTEGEKVGFVRAMRAIRMELGEPDARGRRRPVPVEGSEHEIEVDTVIMAIGTSPNPLIADTTEGLSVTNWGGIIVDEQGLTHRTAVWAGGDAVTGAATVISAMGAGRTAAQAIHAHLTK